MKVPAAILILLIYSCSGPYANFEYMGKGLYYRLNSLGEEGPSLRDAEFLLLRYHFCHDSECRDQQPYREVFIDVRKKNPFADLHLGDGLLLLFEDLRSELAVDLKIPGEQKDFPVIAKCLISAFTDSISYSGKDRDYRTLMKYREKMIIESWLALEPFTKDSTGVFVKVDQPGSGDSIAPSAEVVLSYKAYLGNNHIFDDTGKWKDTLRFTFGKPDQIIKGLELSLSGMREGCEAKLIIPSQLAFGEGGSSSGIVPPFEALTLAKEKILKVNYKNDEVR